MMNYFLFLYNELPHLVKGSLDKAKKIYSRLSLYWYCKRATLLLGIFILFTTNFYRSDAQDNVISLIVPETFATVFQTTILPDFHMANPDVLVELRTVDEQVYRNLRLPSSSHSLNGYLEATNELVSGADVLFVYPEMIIPENTRAGYYLDIEPLLTIDRSSPIEDFIPNILNSFRWDNSLWALPIMATPLIISYDAETFDENNLGYPDENWTFDDYIDAANLLANQNSPGFQVYSNDLPAFFAILYNTDFSDQNILSQPSFDAPELHSFVERWTMLERDGIVTSSYFEDVPLRFARINELADNEFQGVLLNNNASTDVYGVAISSGTSNPQLSYQLALYLTTIPAISDLIPGALSARYSIQSQQSVSQGTLDEEIINLQQYVLENAITPSDLIFGHYFEQILALVSSDQSTDFAINTIQQIARSNLVDAQVLGESNQITVTNTVFGTNANETTLSFGLFTGYTSLPNRSEWERAIEQFVTQNPTISGIELDFIPPTGNFADEFTNNDCVYGYPYTAYPEEMLLTLDPLLDADPTFSTSDLVGDVLMDSQLYGNTYAIPVSVFPYVIQYDREIFQQADLSEPDGAWSVTEFVEILRQINEVTGNPSLYLYYNSSTPWELLMAAYGAAPVDYTTTPPTLRLNDEEVISTSQQVLDLARNGLINYRPMATFINFGEPPSFAPPLTTYQLRGDFSTDTLGNNGFVTFPIGVDVTPISFVTTSGFIFSHASFPEICYEWLREIARSPELFLGMPAYHSVINDPITYDVYGETGVTAFQRFAQAMIAPDRVFISVAGPGLGEAMFLNRAFDRYVLENADLEREFSLAQQLIEIYRLCFTEHGNVIDCLLNTDPTIEDMLPYSVLTDD